MHWKYQSHSPHLNIKEGRRTIEKVNLLECSLALLDCTLEEGVVRFKEFRKHDKDFQLPPPSQSLTWEEDWRLDGEVFDLPSAPFARGVLSFDPDFGVQFLSTLVDQPTYLWLYKEALNSPAAAISRETLKAHIAFIKTFPATATSVGIVSEWHRQNKEKTIHVCRTFQPNS